MNINWEWKAFAEFTDPYVLYRVLQLREQIFIVEQQCAYHDLDDKDQIALHLLGWVTHEENKTLATYGRVFLPRQAEGEPSVSFGRIVVDQRFRGLGLGERLVGEILAYLKTTPFSNSPITISAQYYLVAFYKKFNFENVGEPYDEDGILHVEMIKV